MKEQLIISRIAACISLLTVDSAAQVYKVGDSFVGFAAPDNQGMKVTFKAGDARFILLDSPGEHNEPQNPQDPDWFKKNHALLLVNISDFSALKRKIARSRMKAKPFQILVVEDKTAAARFPRQKGKFTVLLLDQKGIVTGIKFATAGPELKQLVADSSK